MLNPKPDLSLYTVSKTIFDTATYIGFLIFVLALPFGYSTAFLNIGLSFVLFGWVGRMISERKLGWQRTPLDGPIVLFLGLSLIACLFAPHPARSSLGYFWKLLRAILLFYAVIHSRLGSRWQHVVIAFIAAAGISSALGLWYYANDTGLQLAFMGKIETKFQQELADKQISEELRQVLRKHNIPLSETAALLPMNSVEEWKIKDSARNRRYIVRREKSDLNVYIIEQRLAGTFKASNDLGGYLTLLLPLTMGYFVATWHTDKQQRRRTAAFALAGALAIMTTALALTLTRSAWLGVAAATIFIIGYLIKNLKWQIKNSRIWIYLLLILFSLYPISFLIPRHITTRFQTMIERPAGFLKGRPQFWQTALGLIRKYPVKGIGLGRFHYEYQLYQPANKYPAPPHAHHIYLQIAVEQGIPSLILFLWMLTIIARQLYAGCRSIGFWNLGIFVGATAAFISALVYGFGDNLLQQRNLLIFWFINGLIFYPQLYVNTDDIPPDLPIQLEKNEETLGPN